MGNCQRKSFPELDISIAIIDWYDLGDKYEARFEKLPAIIQEVLRRDIPRTCRYIASITSDLCKNPVNKNWCATLTFMINWLIDVKKSAFDIDIIYMLTEIMDMKTDEQRFINIKSHILKFLESSNDPYVISKVNIWREQLKGQAQEITRDDESKKLGNLYDQNPNSYSDPNFLSVPPLIPKNSEYSSKSSQGSNPSYVMEMDM